MYPSLDEDWNNFLINNEKEKEEEETEMGVVNTPLNPCTVPKSTPIYISTKTKIAYLNTSSIFLINTMNFLRIILVNVT